MQLCVAIKAVFYNLSSVEEHACYCTLNYTAYYQHRHSDADKVTSAQSRHTLYAIFWIILRRLSFICRRFGTLCLFHLHRHVGTYINV